MPDTPAPTYGDPTPTYEGPHGSLAFALRMIEKRINQRGWGRTPLMLYQFHQLAIDEPDEGDANILLNSFTVSGAPITGDLAPGSPDIMQELTILAMMMESPLAPMSMAATGNPHGRAPDAHALLGEIFYHDDDSEYAKLRALGITDVMDMPHTREARIGLLITGKNDYLLCQRDKGKSLMWLPVDALASGNSTSLNLLTRIHRANVDTWHIVFGDRS